MRGEQAGASTCVNEAGAGILDGVCALCDELGESQRRRGNSRFDAGGMCPARKRGEA